MTDELYEWNPMPHILAVRCPDCGAEAVFEFAESVLIRGRADVLYFKTSKDFGVQEICSHGWTKLAVYWHRLGTPLSAIDDLPEGYHPGMWEHSEHFVRQGPGDLGTVVCAHCGLRRRHVLEWPQDAFFQIEHRGHVLWAFERSSMVALVDFVASTDRQNPRRPWSGFLMKVPSHFLVAKAREPVLKKLRAKLGMHHG